MRAARELAVEKRDQTRLTTIKSDVLLLDARADKLRRYQGPRQPTMKLRAPIKRPAVGVGNKSEQSIMAVIDSNQVAASVARRYKYSSLDETVCSLATEMELGAIIQEKMMLVETLLVAATNGTETVVNSKAIEEVDKTFAAGSPSLSRLPSFMAVVDRCLHLHKLLCETTGTLEEALKREKKLMEQNRTLPPMTSNVFPAYAQSTTTFTNNNDKEPASPATTATTQAASTDAAALAAAEATVAELKGALKKLERDTAEELKQKDVSFDVLQRLLDAEKKAAGERRTMLAASEAALASAKKDMERMAAAAQAELAQKVAAAQADMMKKQVAHDAVAATAESKSVDRIKDLEAQLQTAEQKLGGAQGSLTTLQEQLAKSTEMIATSQTALETVNGERNRLQNELNALSIQVAAQAVQQDLAVDSEIVEELQRRIQDLTQELGEVRVAAERYDAANAALAALQDEWLAKETVWKSREQDLLNAAALQEDWAAKEAAWKNREEDLVNAGLATLARETELEKSRDQALQSLAVVETKLQAAEAIPARIEQMSKDASTRYHDMVSDQNKEIMKLKQTAAVQESEISSLREETGILKQQVEDLTNSRANTAMKASGLTRREFEDTFEAVMREEFDAMRAAYEKRLEGQRSEMEKVKRACFKEVRQAADKSKADAIRADVACRRKDAEIAHLTEQLSIVRIK
jgi:chromosome segregation ATPase